jgi:glycosyltransferase involved in cell wall biosynthesis
LPREALHMTGYIERAYLQLLYQHATALLARLWNNERYPTRYPTRLGEYLASGRSVIIYNVGEVAELLTDGLSVYVSKPGDAVDFAERTRQAI